MNSWWPRASEALGLPAATSRTWSKISRPTSSSVARPSRIPAGVDVHVAGHAAEGVGAAEQPRVTNAKMSTRAVASGLESELHSIVQSQTGPAWIGYAVPVVPGDRTMCCCDTGRYGQIRGGCSLEGDHGFNMNFNDSKQANLEGPEHLWVLLRVSERKVGRIRTFSEACELNAGGLPFIWLTNVNPSGSVALLSGFVRNTDACFALSRRLPILHTPRAISYKASLPMLS